MTYSFQSLTTIAACDEYINVCSREKTALENRKNIVLARLANDDSTSGLTERVNFLAQHIQMQENLLSQNPPEEDKQELQITLGKLIKERAQLERKIDSIGEHWKIEASFEVNRCEAEIALRDTLMAELNTYKASLPAQGQQAA